MTRNAYNFLHIVFLAFFAVDCSCNAKNACNKLQGMFIFGTSEVDIGNNNHLTGTIAKTNFTPYGIDFPTGPTGRFSNGKNLADHFAELFRLPPVPAFSDPRTGRGAIVHGVSYGSGASGILDETGAVVGKVTSLNEQIGNFERVTVPQLEAQLGSQRTDILPNYLFLVAAGNDDYLLNYFLQKNKTLTPQAFAAKLVSSYFDKLKTLYNLGARKFLLISVYPLGCSPFVSKGQGCIPEPNVVVTMFYDQLMSMVDQIKPQMPGSDIVVVNSVKIMTDIITNAGFRNANSSCCELSPNGITCIANGKVCENRNMYAYFDGQHNTEAFDAILAAKAYTSHDLHRFAHAHQ